MRTVGTLLFPGFELLDVFGPLEMFGSVPDDYRLEMVGQSAGAIASNQGPKAVADIAIADAPGYDIFLIPGGLGTRRLVEDAPLIAWIGQHARKCKIVATVCTGAGLLARTGLLDGHTATSNKEAFAWVKSQGPNVAWQNRARWVRDGKYWTSSGVSAGIDMVLALIADLDGTDTAERVAVHTEYRWNRNAHDDPFATLYDLGDSGSTT